MKPIYIKLTCLVFLLLLAVIKDFQAYKISNYLILFGISLGFIMYIIENGWTRIFIYFFYLLLPVLLLFPLFLIKGLGAGDIKLFSLICGFYGPPMCFKTILLSFIIGGLLSLVKLFKNKTIYYRFSLLHDYIKSVILVLQLKNLLWSEKMRLIPVYYDSKRDGYKDVIHFSTAILLSVVILLIFKVY